MDSRVLSRGKAGGSWVSAVAVCGLVAPASAGAADASVSVGDNSFSPAAVTIAVGDSVTWTNPAGGNPHNVNFDGGLFDPPPAPSPGWSLTRTFATVGSFSYVCDVHSNMDGTVTVAAAGPPPRAARPARAPRHTASPRHTDPTRRRSDHTGHTRRSRHAGR
jgi:plastocyanin